jgi:hypothetical protein
VFRVPRIGGGIPEAGGLQDDFAYSARNCLPWVPRTAK